MCHSKLIARDVERAVEDADDVDVSIVLHEVRDSVMPIQQDSDMARRCEVPVSDLRESRKDLRPFVDSLNRSARSGGIIRRDVLEDVLEPAPGFFGPRYFCHERMRRAISSFEMVRFASESASPRSTMT